MTPEQQRIAIAEFCGWKKSKETIAPNKSKEVRLGDGVQGAVYLVDHKTVRKVYEDRLGEEYKDFVANPKRLIAEGERDAWNKFYEKYMPQYATARIDSDGSLLLPKIPGVSVSKLQSRPEDVSKFKSLVSMMMVDLVGSPMRDIKDTDIFVTQAPSGGTIFLQVDFGEFGTRRLMEEVARVYDEKIQSTPAAQQDRAAATKDYIREDANFHDSRAACAASNVKQVKTEPETSAVVSKPGVRGRSPS